MGKNQIAADMADTMESISIDAGYKAALWDVTAVINKITALEGYPPLAKLALISLKEDIRKLNP